MKNILYPDEYRDSTYGIDFRALYQRGYRGILFDVDNTLVPHGAPADDRAIRLFDQLHQIGFGTCIISNNKEPRVRGFCDSVGAYYVHKAGKPKPSGYRKGMKKLGTRPDNTIFIGDQIFTDVVGARLAGLYVIMVRPIHPKEEIQIILKRIPEKLILFFYKRKERKDRAGRRGRRRKDAT